MKNRCTMTNPIPRDVLVKVRKLALLPAAVDRAAWPSGPAPNHASRACVKTRVANRFVVYLARKTFQRVQRGKGARRILTTASDASTKN